MASVSFAMSSANFDLELNLNSGGGIASSDNFILDANIGSPAVGDSESANFKLSLTSIQSASASAPPSSVQESGSTDSSAVASISLNTTGLDPTSVSFTVGSQVFPKSFTMSSDVESVYFNVLISPAASGTQVTIKIS